MEFIASNTQHIPEPSFQLERFSDVEIFDFVNELMPLGAMVGTVTECVETGRSRKRGK